MSKIGKIFDQQRLAKKFSKLWATQNNVQQVRTIDTLYESETLNTCYSFSTIMFFRTFITF